MPKFNYVLRTRSDVFVGHSSGFIYSDVCFDEFHLKVFRRHLNVNKMIVHNMSRCAHLIDFFFNGVLEFGHSLFSSIQINMGKKITFISNFSSLFLK